MLNSKVVLHGILRTSVQIHGKFFPKSMLQNKNKNWYEASKENNQTVKDL